MDEQKPTLFDRSAWKTIIIAFVVMVVGLAVLLWQFNLLEKKELAGLEQKLQAQAQQIEKENARELLRSFLDARINSEERQAMRFLTENSAQTFSEDSFHLLGDFSSYTASDGELAEDGYYRFEVNMMSGDMSVEFEVIGVRKFPDGLYYIDSVELAG